MFIERVQIEEGFLDGADIRFSPGLNVIIGERGTGKTSLIELLRYALGVRGHTSESDKRALEHALSVLGSGQVTVTLNLGGQQVSVSRTVGEEQPRASGTYVMPTIFSQTEIETVGLSPAGRLRLLDSFVRNRATLAQTELATISEIKSLTSEIANQRTERAEIQEQLKQLPDLNSRIVEVEKREQNLTKHSAAVAAKKKDLDSLSKSSEEFAVSTSYLSRLGAAVQRWKGALDSILHAGPDLEGAVKNDPAAEVRRRFEKAREYIAAAHGELIAAETSLQKTTAASAAKKLEVENRARQLRKEIETLQQGAGAIVRDAAALREQRARLLSLNSVLESQTTKLKSLIHRRNDLLDRLDALRQERFDARQSVATQLSSALGPRIQVNLERAGQVDKYANALAEALRGSGLRYNELAPIIAEKISPRELLDAVENRDFETVAEIAEITRDRAARLLDSLREAGLADLATVKVEDDVSLKLLDGSEYKDITDVSTGQRCTVILPIVLEHKERVVVVDQPEDHIDNAFIADTVVRALLERGENGQIIFTTHNPNIPVLGNAQRVIQLGSDGRRGYELVAAELEDASVVRAITGIMEGGKEAFKKRASFYAKYKA